VDTSGGKLDELQKRVLDSLPAVRPPFILGGGGALAGVHLAHGKARDLETRLTNEGLTVSPLQRSPLFVELRADDASASSTPLSPS